MDAIDEYRANMKCVAGSMLGPQKIIVRQVIGEGQEQKSLDLCIVVPRRKPSIEQIIDVFVRHVTITSVEIIHNKVIVCGCFEVKAIYVACIPEQPVHAIEMRNVRFTADIPIWGACRGMDAEANVHVEFVDYSCDKRSRAHWYKEYERKFKHTYWQEQEDYHTHHDDFDDCHQHDECHQHDKCHHECEICYPPCTKKCSRKFHVSVVLSICAKVMGDREILVYPGYQTLPNKPKG